MRDFDDIRDFVTKYMRDLRDSAPDQDWIPEYAASAAVECYHMQHPQADELGLHDVYNAALIASKFSQENGTE